MSTIKKLPPEKTIRKIPLKKIIKNKKTHETLFDATKRAHQIKIHVDQFFRLWLLNKYYTCENNSIPILTDDVIYQIFMALTIPDKRGPPTTGNNLKYLNEFKKFYDDEYSKLGYSNKISSAYLSQIIIDFSKEVITNLENNIRMHFAAHLFKFIDGEFKNEHAKILDKLKGEKRKEQNAIFRRELFALKEDLMENKKDCDPKYHKWLDENRHKLLPSDFMGSYQIDIECVPQKYIKYMIYMAIKLEDRELKLFQFCPIRTEITVKYCPFDTTSLVKLLIYDNQKKYLDDITEHKKEIWNTFFKMDNKIFKEKYYDFDYRIVTDGYSASLQFINKIYVDKNTQKKENKLVAREKMKTRLFGLSDEQKEAKREEIKIDKQKAEYEKRIENQKKRDEFKKLPKSEKDKKNMEYKEAKQKTKKELEIILQTPVSTCHDQSVKSKNVLFQEMTEEMIQKVKTYFAGRQECPYLDELNAAELEEVRNAKLVYVDPGKKNLFYAMSSDGKILRYKNRQRLKETKRLKYQTLIENHKDRLGITVEEQKLTNENSKTCNIEKFKSYIKTKNEVNKILLEKYEDEKFRKLKWYGYINRKKSEDNLLDKIEEEFGKDCIIIMGDWSTGGKQMKNYISTPNIGLKRKIGDRFKTYSIDEFRTTCISNKTETYCTNLYLPDKNGKNRKLHSVLSYQMTNGRMGCINRDSNSVCNMKKITEYFLKHGKRPLVYQRGYDLKTKPKVVDPNHNVNKEDDKASSNNKPERVLLQ